MSDPGEEYPYAAMAERMQTRIEATRTMRARAIDEAKSAAEVMNEVERLTRDFEGAREGVRQVADKLLRAYRENEVLIRDLGVAREHGVRLRVENERVTAVLQRQREEADEAEDELMFVRSQLANIAGLHSRNPSSGLCDECRTIHPCATSEIIRRSRELGI